MRRMATPLLILVCLLGLLSACFGRALFRNEQFGYRDAAHFYYPLYQRVQTEWQAGRLPLWDPEENAGMPLLGNPTAAVLYPGKLIYAVFPYALAAKLYIVAHTLLAFAGTFLLLRSWRTSREGAALGGLSFAFGAPVLFQYCNIIYLVGAAWLPLGFLAVDRWLRLRSRFALLGLAIVLAMETLGGDPEMAYLTGLAAGGYAILLTRDRRATGATATGLRTGLILTVVGIGFWIAAALAMARVAPMVREARPPGQPPSPLPWMVFAGPTVAIVWLSVGLVMFLAWRKARLRMNPGEAVSQRLVPMFFGLVGSAVLAGSLTAVQVLPVMEFTGLTGRAASDGPHEIYQFSLEPLRVVEFLWPNLFGTSFQGNRSWLTLIWLTDRTVKSWVPSLYFGTIAFFISLGSLRFCREDSTPWRSWLSIIAVVSLVASMGEFTSPLYWARFSPAVARMIGPHDDEQTASIRFDRQLRDGDGSVYWALATFLPGFRQFRFPSKMLTLTILSFASLAGLGWDSLMAGDAPTRRRVIGCAVVMIVLSMIALATTLVWNTAIVTWIKAGDRGSPFGPLDAPGAISEMRRALLQGASLMALTLALICFGPKRQVLAAGILLLATSADLAVANARYILTVPQSLFEGTPEVVRLINEAEKKNPTPGPFRVHRMPIWDPIGWRDEASKDRVRDFVEWERKTIQPKYGITEGISYTMVLGVAELYDYEWYFGAFRRQADEVGAKMLGVNVGSEVVVNPRRSFDMWNTRYFVTPTYSGGWKDEHRGYASFLEQTKQIAPPLELSNGPGAEERSREWSMKEDYQIRLNLNCYPRAWVVHESRFLPQLRGLSRESRNGPMQEILYSGEIFWTERSRTVYDPKRLVWLENDDKEALQRGFSGVLPTSRENVVLTRYESDRVELDVSLETPGMVVLSDIYYPGWTLTIDGVPAPVYRANRMMRGAAVKSGKHKLVYQYRPRSVQVGLIISALGLISLVSLAVRFVTRPRPVLA